MARRSPARPSFGAESGAGQQRADGLGNGFRDPSAAHAGRFRGPPRCPSGRPPRPRPPGRRRPWLPAEQCRTARTRACRPRRPRSGRCPAWRPGAPGPRSSTWSATPRSRARSSSRRASGSCPPAPAPPPTMRSSTSSKPASLQVRQGHGSPGPRPCAEPAGPRTGCGAARAGRRPGPSLENRSRSTPHGAMETLRGINPHCLQFEDLVGAGGNDAVRRPAHGRFEEAAFGRAGVAGALVPAFDGAQGVERLHHGHPETGRARGVRRPARRCRTSRSGRAPRPAACRPSPGPRRRRARP